MMLTLLMMGRLSSVMHLQNLAQKMEALMQRVSSTSLSMEDMAEF